MTRSLKNNSKPSSKKNDSLEYLPGKTIHKNCFNKLYIVLPFLITNEKRCT